MSLDVNYSERKGYFSVLLVLKYSEIESLHAASLTYYVTRVHFETAELYMSTFESQLFRCSDGLVLSSIEGEIA